MGKEEWGYFSLAVSVVGYIPYFHAILKGRCKPHFFSWIIWSWSTGFLFIAQSYRGAGAGAWVTGLTAIASMAIAALSFKYGEKDVTSSDEITFGFALAALPLWIVTQDPLWSVILLVSISACGFFPTFRKSYFRPQEEHVLFYVSCVLKSFFGFLALESYITVTALYPIYGIIANGAFIIMLLWRRAQTTPASRFELQNLAVKTNLAA